MQEPPPAPHDELAEVRRGLRMARPPDPARLEEERRFLSALEERGAGARMRGYLRLVGPGYLQSAMTLGGGTFASALFAGATFGYSLLWVAPVAMVLGVIMLAAVSHQTLSTGLRPFEAMRRFAGAPFAWAWALGALIASIIWHFPQYSLAAAVLADLGDLAGAPGIPPWTMGLLVLAWAVSLSMLYGSSPTLIRTYERILKYMVWGIVACFGLVVLETGIRDWGALARGLFTFEVPAERSGVAGLTLVAGGLAAAVGVNMVFLYPYSLLARGWGREHRRLARFDLLAGMLLPYALAASLMVVAAANTLHLDPGIQGQHLSAEQAARTLGGLLGPAFSRVVLDLGVLGMALSSITLQMLCAGFVGVELFGFPVGSWRYRLATLLPVPGVLGPVLWGDIAVWVAVPTSIVCGFFLPAAYLGFIRMQRSRGYLGRDLPAGPKGAAWLGGMILATAVLVAFLAWYAVTEGPKYLEKILPWDL